MSQLNISELHAHTKVDGRVDGLRAHSARVAVLARRFAGEFGSGELAAILGYLHDVGKALPDFQSYLQQLEAGERLAAGPPHAIWGAALWYAIAGGRAWREVCLPIAGHHAGLRASAELSTRLVEFIREHHDTLELLRSAVLASGMLADARPPCPAMNGTALEFRVRLLLSALADADFLATEEHFDPTKTAMRANWPALADLSPGFEEKQEALIREAACSPNSVQTIRESVYRDCLRAAELPPGLFRLTVPTGGGKTRSGLGFALRHAVRHGLRRIVLAVPYTTITEQSAKVYREILGAAAVLEHHSALRIGFRDDEGQAPEAVLSRLAAENWDATVVVTTTVQLFESLFARRPGRVRKLHNLVRSVVLLDEVQTLPLELLDPTLDAVRTLIADYGATVVLCTATQPAFDDTPYLKAFEDMPVREIVPDPARHFGALKRVRYERRLAALSWVEVAAELRSHPQVLLIVNTRRDAIALLDQLSGDESVLHMSTLLCGAHRQHVLQKISNRLSNGLPVRAISTQVVEAGVDLDFPVVYRAIGPLDRIVQAAGRCNRSGIMSEPGRVVIFEPADGGMPKGAYRAGFEQARVLLNRNPTDRLHDPELYREYFQRLFSNVDLDKRGIQQFRAGLDFPEVASRYYFIPETVPILVKYDGIDQSSIERWRHSPSRGAWRRLQPFMVNLYKREADQYAADGLIGEVGAGLYQWFGKYDELRGIVAEAADPADYVV